MGLENRPAPKAKVASLPKNLPEVKIQSDNPDDVRDFEKKQSAKKVLEALPTKDDLAKISAKISEKPAKSNKVALSTKEDDLAKISAKISEMPAKSNKVALSDGEQKPGEKVETHNLIPLTQEQKNNDAKLMGEFAGDIDFGKDPLDDVVIAGSEQLAASKAVAAKPKKGPNKNA